MGGGGDAGLKAQCAECGAKLFIMTNFSLFLILVHELF